MRAALRVPMRVQPKRIMNDHRIPPPPLEASIISVQVIVIMKPKYCRGTWNRPPAVASLIGKVISLQYAYPTINHPKVVNPTRLYVIVTSTLLSVSNESMNRTRAAVDDTPIAILEVLYISVLF